MEKHCEPESIEDVLECVEGAGEGHTRVSVSDIVDRIGDEAFAPLMLVPALIALSPASAIFGLSTICGLTIALIAVQIVIGRPKLWLPDLILRQTISARRRDQVVHVLSKPAHFVDGLTHRRLSIIVAPPLDRVWALVCMSLALLMPALELVPMSASIIAGAISLFALAILARDGLVGLLGLAILGGAWWFLWSVAT
ncbi:exopolysaccharide biosynthesis protein [Mesorhizobium sp. CAU 1741]|uniref:exopolysaccharide biosynthesis protein n=1 Tax=Mesorhizobium sp. CAU 1741 TaxID=3140366 RepID=UPI00325B68F8